MGLDMFLTANRFFWSHEREKHTIELKGLNLIPEGFEIKSINIDVGYWRNANAIHKWFVDSVQDGKDECHPHDVSREQLTELKQLCKDVLSSDVAHAETFLPTQEGFFFGDVGYDDYYYEDLRETIKIIDKALSLPDEWDFEYCSSW